MACGHLVAINGTVTGWWPTAMQSGNTSLLSPQVQWLPHLITAPMVSITNTGQLTDKCQLSFTKSNWFCQSCSWGEAVTWQEATGRSSIAVEPNGVDRGGNGSAAVAPPLLLGLLVSERLALGEPEDVVGLLAPVAAGSPLSARQKQAARQPRVRVSESRQYVYRRNDAHLCVKWVVCQTGIHVHVLFVYPTERDSCLKKNHF